MFETKIPISFENLAPYRPYPLGFQELVKIKDRNMTLQKAWSRSGSNQ